MHPKTEHPVCFIGSPILSKELLQDADPFASTSFDSMRRRRLIHSNVPLYLEGDSPRKLYVLAEGDIEIRRRVRSEDVLIRNAIPGEILGIREAISRNRIEYDVVTSSDCWIDVIERRDFVKFVRGDCQVCFGLLKTIGADLQNSYQSFIACPNTSVGM